jgi:hypothetical protein
MAFEVSTSQWDQLLQENYVIQGRRRRHQQGDGLQEQAESEAHLERPA